MIPALALCAHAAALAVTQPQTNADLPTITITHDDTRIDQSCRVVIPKGTVIPDANGNGVIHIAADNIRVEFVERQAELLGTPEDAHYELMTGVGIRIDGFKNVTLITPHTHRYKVGIWASDADGLVIDGADLAHGYAMKLGSTPLAEDSSDWLWPHKNDSGEWRENYGAGIYVERSRGVAIRNCFARKRQNAIVLDRVTDSTIVGNDCSFLSGWGLAMWRSSRNIIARNAFDFCIRGYSHGVYNRGQDSAGLLCFEQCSENLFSENSCTHGGDGFFGFAGHEALGENQVPEGFDHTRKGCNDNIIKDNDFSYAAAHGLEMTFSFGNRIQGNRFVENAICGIWGGYSQDSSIEGNAFEGNGSAGYGLERGGVNIEHSAGNIIRGNSFRNDAVGVHLWVDEDAALRSKPWARANYRGGVDNTIASNAFDGVGVGVQLRGGVKNTVVAANMFKGRGKQIEADAASQVVEGESVPPAEYVDPPAIDDEALARAIDGVKSPIGAREKYRGREFIIMDEYFPWDFQQPLARVKSLGSSEHVYEVFGVKDTFAYVVNGEGITQHFIERPPVDAPLWKPITVTVRAEPGVHPYTLDIFLDDQPRRLEGVILATTWNVKCFPWTIDPQKDVQGWRAHAEGIQGVEVASLDLRFAHGGPAAAGLAFQAPPDRFGTIATSTVALPPGKWRIRTLSDDGVRVTVDGAVVIDNWTWHPPTENTGEFTVGESGKVEILVEHFEIDGYAVLTVDFEPVGD